MDGAHGGLTTMEQGRPEDLFELLEQLGKGSYGAVYKARHRPSGTVVAVKVIPLTGEDEEGLEDIRREIAVLSGVRPSQRRALLRLVHGRRVPLDRHGALRRRQRARRLTASGAPLSESQIAYLCGESLKGLVYLHSINKVHRDIKCSNILLTESGGVKLADFGVAAQLTRTMSSATPSSALRTGWPRGDPRSRSTVRWTCGRSASAPSRWPRSNPRDTPCIPCASSS